MANTHQHIDLTTLKEVERLLTTAEIATSDASTATTRGMDSAPELVGGMAPLPKRR